MGKSPLINKDDSTTFFVVLNFFTVQKNNYKIVIKKENMSYALDLRRKILGIKKKEGVSYEESGSRFKMGKQSIEGVRV
ncbi:hypothetical protein HCUR_00633 [Holospora curviuscula]|uniref:Uncharacterized protein n=2 Tax=Holospora curviuscula TaxID=1082868 RepID=A0A2S5R957_9PROT|nr:hypothetical protein HCUR_00633 [Holospora curviuscula]